MREVHYKNKTMRIADKTWDSLKEKRRKSNLSWNLFIMVLLLLYKKHGHDKKFSPENLNRKRVSPQQEKSWKGKHPPPQNQIKRNEITPLKHHYRDIECHSIALEAHNTAIPVISLHEIALVQDWYIDIHSLYCIKWLFRAIRPTQWLAFWRISQKPTTLYAP